MLPRVSMFARIFLVAAFLALVAQGPTFGGKGQVAQSGATVVTGGVCTTCGVTNDNKAVDKTVEVKDGKTTVTEDKSSPCRSGNEGTKEWKDNGCDTRKGVTTAKGGVGDVSLQCADGEKNCGPVGSGTGAGGGASNPSAAQQYADSKPYISQTPITPPNNPQTAQAINDAFKNPSQYIGGQGSPVSAQAVAQAQNNIPANVYSPQASGVQGTTLGYDGDLGGGKSIALNDNLYTNAAALSAQQQSQGGLQAVPAYIPPSTGATMAVPGAVSPIAAGFQAAAAQWDASQPLGGVSSGQAGAMSPSEVFFADAQQRLTPAAGGPVVTRFTSEQWSTFQASGQSLGQYVGTDYPIVVDFGIQGVSVLRGQDFGITTDGTINIAGVNADTSYIGNGTLQDKIAYTLSRTLDSTAVSGIMNSRNVETGTSLASAIGAEYAQAKSSETFTDSVYRFFTEHGGPRLTVTGSSLPPLGETAIVQGPSNAELAQMRSQDQPQEAATIAAAKDHPATVLGSDANTLGKIVVAGQDGTQSGRAPDRASPGGGGGGNVSQGARDGVGGQVAVGTSPSSQSGVESAGAQQSGFTLPPVEVDTTAAPQGTAASAGVQHGVLMVPESGLGPKVDLPSFPAGPELQARIAATQEDVDRTGKGGLYDFGGGVSLHLTPKNALPPIEGTVVASTPGFDTARSVDPQEVAAAVDVPASVHASEVSGPSVADTGPTDAQIAREAQGQTGAQVAESRPSGSSGQQTAEAKEDTRTWWERFLGITTPVPSPPEQLQRFAEYNAANPPTEQHGSAGFLGDFFGSAAEAAPAQKSAKGVIAQFQGIASCYDPLNKTSCGGTKFEGGLQIAGKGGTYLGNDIPTAALQLSKALATGCGVNGQDCVARVTNVATGKSVEVRINDNGPLFNGRVIDLNPAAKQAIGAGDLSKVRVEILGKAGGVTPNVGVTRSGFQVSISATAPGQKPVEMKMQAAPAAKPVSFGIGSRGSDIDQDAYINSLCQSDRGCAAKSLGATPDTSYPRERVMTNAAERDAEYERQVAAAGARSNGRQGVDVDNCQYSGSGACMSLLQKMAEWNAAHPDKTLVPLVNNPLHVAEKLGAAEAARLMNMAGSMGGGAIVERGAGTPAQNDALRKAAGVPNAPILFVGTRSEIDPVEAAIASGKLPNMGTSVSSASEGDVGYRDAKAGLPIALGGSAAQKELAEYAAIQKPFMFAKDGKFLNASEAAQAHARGEPLDVYETSSAPPPFRLDNKSNYLKDDATGQWYQRQGTAAEYASQKQQQAQASLENAARSAQLEQKLGRPVVVDGVGGARQVYEKVGDGGRGVQIGRVTTVTGDVAKASAVAAATGVALTEKDGKLVDTKGRTVELRSVPNPDGENSPFVQMAKQGGTPQIPGTRFPTKYFQPLNDTPRSGVLGIISHQSHGPLGSGFNTARSQSGGPVGAEWWVMGDGTILHSDTERSTGNVGQNNPPGAPKLLSLLGAGNGGMLGNARAVGIEFEGMIGSALTPEQIESGKALISFLQERYDLGPESILKHGKGGGAEGAEMEAIARAMNYQPGSGQTYVQLYALGENGAEALGAAVPASAAGDAKTTTVFQPTDAQGNPHGTPIALEALPDVGKAAARLTTDKDGNLSITYDYTPPPQEDTRSLWQKAQDSARTMWNSLTGNGSAQPYDAMRPAGNAQPAGGAGGGSGGGAQTQPSQQAKPQQPIPVMPSQQEVPTAPATLVCSQNVVSGDTNSKVTISWKCPAGTTPIGSGFSTIGSVSGSITVSVSTTSASIRYGIACSGTKTPQTASCTVKVLHPSVLLVARPSSIPNGTAAHLEWSAKDVTSCALYAPPTVLLTTGGATGQATTLPLSQPTRFRIRCETGATPITNAVVVNLDTDAGTPVDTILP